MCSLRVCRDKRVSRSATVYVCNYGLTKPRLTKTLDMFRPSVENYRGLYSGPFLFNELIICRCSNRSWIGANVLNWIARSPSDCHND